MVVDSEVCYFKADIEEASRRFMPRVMSLELESDLLKGSITGSYRGNADLVSDLLNRDKEERIQYRTLCNKVDASGKAISGEIEKVTTEILEETAGFNPSDGLVLPNVPLERRLKGPGRRTPGETWKNELSNIISKINTDRDDDSKVMEDWRVEAIENDKEQVVMISIDDVGVKRQKSGRPGNKKSEPKTVQNTNIDIRYDGKRYYITAESQDEAMRRLIAFLIANNLMGRRFVFMADGATKIKSGLEKYFSFRKGGDVLILDWEHLRKHVYELLSMAIKGKKEEKEQIRMHIYACLWAGNVDGAKRVIRNIPSENIKSQRNLQNVIDYLDRKDPMIACYAVRKELRLRTSSNTVEKENDLLVAERQKHNGMSWSGEGSRCNAAVAAAYYNGELMDWVYRRKINFTGIVVSKAA